MKRYTPSHEWIEVENGMGTVGISEFAVQELGEIVYIEFPKIGALVKGGEEILIMESTKAAVDLYSPVGGTITAVNIELKNNPELLQTTSPGKLWLFKLKVSNLEELNALLSFEDYQKLLKG